jgi:group I intron endonuclease
MKARRESGIYKITNTINSRIYIGSSNFCYLRWHQHKYKLNHNIHTNIHLQKEWIKYGEEAFSFSILEVVEEFYLMDREQYWLDLLPCNISEGGYNISRSSISSRGVKKKPLSESHKLKIGLALKGKPISEETKRKISKANKGSIRSLESRAKMSEARKGKTNKVKRKPPSPETIRRFKETIAKRTPEQKEKLRLKQSEITKRQMDDPERRRHLSNLNKGKKLSEEAKAKIRATLKSKPIHKNSRIALNKNRKRK